MNNSVQLLDCTLRDGGYCNQWNFGHDNIQRVLKSLVDAQIDIIECGFLTNKVIYDEDFSKFTCIDQISKVLPSQHDGKLFVCMMNYGEYDVEALPQYNGKSIDGIRVAFHKKDAEPALKLCERIKKKGYLVFIQAMVSLSYADEEFLTLIRRCNELDPYAFYIVDSFGVMKRKDLIRLFYLVEHNLKEKIRIGYHSHNNMQLAYSNAQALVDIRTNRNLIIDSSVFGMGRGAGNLNTELFVEYLNEVASAGYQLQPLLNLIDEILNRFYQSNYWGYSLPNYLSATHNAHPNYAGYLDDKKTLTIQDMDSILEMMSPEKRVSYDKHYIESLYLEYMEKGRSQNDHLNDFRTLMKGKKVLIIAPGKSSLTEKEKIVAFASRQGIMSIAINFDYSGYHTDWIFLSNLRRFREIDKAQLNRCIVTSNVPAKEAWLQMDYKALATDVEAVRDNAGMMLLNFLIQIGVEEIYLAGLDGYSADAKENYAENRMRIVSNRATLDAMNNGMQQLLTKYSQQVSIHFLTEPKCVHIVEECAK